VAGQANRSFEIASVAIDSQLAMLAYLFATAVRLALVKCKNSCARLVRYIFRGSTVVYRLVPMRSGNFLAAHVAECSKGTAIQSQGSKVAN
jgi:hypothetical protein